MSAKHSNVPVTVFSTLLTVPLLLGALLMFAFGEFSYSMHGAGAGHVDWERADAIHLRDRLIAAGMFLSGLVAAVVAVWQWFGFFYVPAKAVGHNRPDAGEFMIEPIECEQCNMVITRLNADQKCPYCRRWPNRHSEPSLSPPPRRSETIRISR